LEVEEGKDKETRGEMVNLMKHAERGRWRVTFFSFRLA